MSSPDVARKGSPQNATDAEPQCLRKDTTNWIELVRARHETRIRRDLVDWCAETASGCRGIPALTRQQQSNLQRRVVDMFVELGEARLMNLLVQTPLPQQFESETDHLIENEASEAQARWTSLTTRYCLEAGAAETAADPGVDVRQGVLHQLIRVAERYRLRAWVEHEKRLEAECASTAPVLSDQAMPSSESSLSAVRQRPTSRSLAQKIDDLRVNHGWSEDELAVQAKISKKTVLGIYKGSRPHPSTLKRIADALGVTATELKPDVQDPTAPS